MLTPTAADYRERVDGEVAQWQAAAENGTRPATTAQRLRAQVAHELLPTACAKSGKKSGTAGLNGGSGNNKKFNRMWAMLPTPTRAEGKNNANPSRASRHAPEISSVIAAEMGDGAGSSRLQPEFVEWMMGYPSGYTQLGGETAPHEGYAISWLEKASQTCFAVESASPNRTNRLKILGNAIQPQIPAVFFAAIMKIERLEQAQ